MRLPRSKRCRLQDLQMRKMILGDSCAGRLPLPSTSTEIDESSRRAFIEWHLREAGIDAERISAVEGLNVPGAPGIGRRPS